MELRTLTIDRARTRTVPATFPPWFYLFPPTTLPLVLLVSIIQHPYSTYCWIPVSARGVTESFFLINYKQKQICGLPYH